MKALAIGIAASVVLGMVGLLVLGTMQKDKEARRPPVFLTENSTRALKNVGVDIGVTDCTYRQDASASASLTITSREPWTLLQIQGRITDSRGFVIGQGIERLHEVVPGRSYQADMLYTLCNDCRAVGRVSCTAFVTDVQR